jgi:large subunit ribosomal protein L12
MQYIYAALLLNSAGKTVDESSLKKTLESTGEKADEAKVKAIVAALDGVNIKEVIEKAAIPTVAAGAAPAQAEKKKEEPEENKEQKAEEAAAGLSALFG